MGVDDLSPVAQNYVKSIWHATEWDEPPITTTGLAQRFGTSQANVSLTLRRLEAQGLVVYKPYHPVTLTPQGEKAAIMMVRRHRLIEAYLQHELGYHWGEIHDEAESMEHAVSALFIQRIDEKLGHPRFDPHGDPIPTADGQIHRVDATPLREAGRGKIARISDADTQLVSRCYELGLGLGSEVDARKLPDELVEMIWVTASTDDHRG